MERQLLDLEIVLQIADVVRKVQQAVAL